MKVLSKLAIGDVAPTQELEVDKGNLRFNTLSPPSAPTVAVNPTAGNLNGTYYYAVTFVTAKGETELGTLSASVAPVNQQVNVTNIPIGPAGVTARKLYRTKGDGNVNVLYFVVAIQDNQTTSYTDNIADGSLGEAHPAVNSTGGLIFGNLSPIFAVGDQGFYIGKNAGGTYRARDNSCIGNYAGESLTTGSYNLFVGRMAGNSVTTGWNNTYVGSYSGRYWNGIGNVAIGRTSAYGPTSGGYNVVLGNDAGNADISGATLSSYSNCVLIGYDTRLNTNGDYNEIVIGGQARGNGSNSVTLGNDSITKTILKGNVGVGTTSPTAKLHAVAATGYDQLRLQNPYTPTSSADPNGNVGDIAWDNNYIYVKTSTGWKRAALAAF